MLNVGLIGYGAIAQYVAEALPRNDAQLSLVIARPGREDAARAALGGGAEIVEAMGDHRPDVIIDCAGHAALKQNGPAILRAGVPLITVSLGALADDAVYKDLSEAAKAGGTALHLASGAIGSLDAIASARFGDLRNVTYIGRKPPRGWKGSHAEQVIDLDALTEAATHFDGTARDAALLYPKNANVAAAVALAGIGFDRTGVKLIADPDANANIHEIRAEGDFGDFVFTIAGKTLPDNTRSSALAAMSVVKTMSNQRAAIRI